MANRKLESNNQAQTKDIFGYKWKKEIVSSQIT